MLSEDDRRGWNAIDKAAKEAGGYLAPPNRPLIIEHDYRAMTQYCREKNISKIDMTEDEIKMFEYPEPLIYA